MGKKSFKLNPNFCLIKLGNPNSECVFDSWSIHHFYWQGFAYIIIHHFLKLNKIKHIILTTVILSIIHIIEEYFGNTQRLSIEGIVIDYIGPLINKKIDPSLREIDNDYLDNSIGDILSGLFSNILIILYWYKFRRLPYFYLFFIVLLIINLLLKAKQLYRN
mgnify:CR=1 FL=1